MSLWQIIKNMTIVPHFDFKNLEMQVFKETLRTGRKEGWGIEMPVRNRIVKVEKMDGSGWC